MKARINGTTVEAIGRWDYSGITGDGREIYAVDNTLYYGSPVAQGQDRYLALERVPNETIARLHKYSVLRDFN
jgi:hypothetical protein